MSQSPAGASWKTPASRLPIAPNASATSMAPTAAISAVVSLATTTRDRRGSSVNVTRPGALPHSLVTSRIARTGSRNAGRDVHQPEHVAEHQVLVVRPDQHGGGDQRRHDADGQHQPQPGPGVDEACEARRRPGAPSARRPRGVDGLEPRGRRVRRQAGRCGGRGRWRSCGGSSVRSSLWVSAVSSEEHLLQPGAVGGVQLEQRQAGRGSCPTESLWARPRCAGPRRRTAWRRLIPAAVSAADSAGRSSALTKVPARCSSSALVPCGDDLAAADEDQLVGDHLDLVQQVGGQEHGAAAVGVLAQQPAHPVDAGRVEPVGRLVEDQHARVAEQRVGDAEALAHAERVVAHAAPASAGVRPTSSSISSTRVRRQTHRRGADREHLAAGAARVLGRGVEEHPDGVPGLGMLAVAVAADRDACPPLAGVSPTMIRIVVDLPAPFGPEETGDPPGSARRRTRRRRPVKPPYVLVSRSTVIMRSTLSASGAPLASVISLIPALSRPSRAAIGSGGRRPVTWCVGLVTSVRPRVLPGSTLWRPDRCCVRCRRSSMSPRSS